ncbi:hypothetical protein SDC9_66560 [bioreactor metagenome]|uniref:Uncharacterized protein n=1 Tax=bioreactor metagenome TaxID=1076179 RepID=A0A644XWU0_9ZZZZ
MDGRVQPEPGQLAGRTAQLLVHLVEVVEVDVGVTEGVHEVTHVEVADLGDHMGEQRVRGDVERHAEEHVGGALVELQRQPSPRLALGRRRHVELEEGVAGRQCHLRDVRHVPGGHDVAAGVWVVPDRLDHPGELVDRAAVLRVGPGAPLVAVDRAEVAVGAGPLVPDRDPVLMQPLDVGRALDEPEQFAEHRAGVHLLGGQQREAGAQVEPQLGAEDADRAGAGAVGLAYPGVEDVLEQVQVLLHGDPSQCARVTGCSRSPLMNVAIARTARPR